MPARRILIRPVLMASFAISALSFVNRRAIIPLCIARHALLDLGFYQVKKQFGVRNRLGLVLITDE